MSACFSYYYFGYGSPTLSLSHKRHYDDSDVFIDAISFVFRRNPTITSLKIETSSVFPNSSISWDHLCSFKHLSWLDLQGFQIHDPDFFSIPGCFETLTIPDTARKLVLPEDCSSMHCIRSFSTSLFSLVAANKYNPITVPPDFRILVNPDILNQYSSLESWCHVSFISSIDQSEIIPCVNSFKY